MAREQVSKDQIKLAAGWALEISEFDESNLGVLRTHGGRIAYVKFGSDFGERVNRHVREFSPEEESSGLGSIDDGCVRLSFFGDSHRNFQELRYGRGF
jgi:hypothetical protein